MFSLMIKSLRENNLNIKNKNEKLEHFLSNKLYHRRHKILWRLINIFNKYRNNIFIWNIFKKIKKITFFSTNELRAKGIHINSIRKSLIVTIFSFLNNINNIQCFEIPFKYLLLNEKIIINDFNRILKSEEFLDSECYIQFDEFNKIILTRNILRTNKIWNFENFSKNFEFT